VRADNIEDGLHRALEILHSPALRKTMGDAGRDFAQSHRGATARTVNLLTPLLKTARPRKPGS
jgi:3-deoxy-D-manno-octulosonic-acid transferase